MEGAFGKAVPLYPSMCQRAGWSAMPRQGEARSSMSSQKWAWWEGQPCRHQTASDQRTHTTLYFSVLRPENSGEHQRKAQGSLVMPVLCS